MHCMFLSQCDSSRSRGSHFLRAPQPILFANREHTSGTRKTHLLESHAHAPAPGT